MPGAAGSTRLTRRSAKAQSSTPRSSTDANASTLKNIEALSKLTEVNAKVSKLSEDYKQELHEKRLKELHKRLREAQKEDNWRYPPLFGLGNRR